ncbi:hypothetical protein MTR67_023927, partial [Solanum verrucosum]
MDLPSQVQYRSGGDTTAGEHNGDGNQNSHNYSGVRHTDSVIRHNDGGIRHNGGGVQHNGSEIQHISAIDEKKEESKSPTSLHKLTVSSPYSYRQIHHRHCLIFDQIEFELYMAYIMDTNEEERVKGITIEVGRAPFEIETTRFTILGAPVTFYPHSFSGLPCTREEQGTEIQLGLALKSQNATLSVKRRLACETVSYYAQTLCCLSGDNNFHGTAKKHLLFIKWKYLEAK